MTAVTVRPGAEALDSPGAGRPGPHDGEEVDAMDDTASSRHPSTPVVLRAQA
ncbi:hypothetical protein MHY85_12225 [Cellulomonas sp. ACRRI]|uniref:hypothetical protein n=1 Tax=Cellulomonas sp. ACRRI TaxID=2918188 RepID=UPI001EF1ED4A|nr:hypothetical protein [Cellulomonas sp. ACRRI]MCG7286735.1 hypothetical protein [Cellulomonas sp. ACRRI]